MYRIVDPDSGEEIDCENMKEARQVLAVFIEIGNDAAYIEE